VRVERKDGWIDARKEGAKKTRKINNVDFSNLQM